MNDTSFDQSNAHVSLFIETKKKKRKNKDREKKLITTEMRNEQKTAKYNIIWC